MVHLKLVISRRQVQRERKYTTRRVVLLPYHWGQRLTSLRVLREDIRYKTILFVKTVNLLVNGVLLHLVKTKR